MEIIESSKQLNHILNFIYKNEITFHFIHYLSVFLLNLVSYLYIFVKFYKVLCYSKMTFEWLPMINPYVWPFSIFQILTGPYFSFWSKIFPGIRFETSSLEISGVVALESLNSIIYFCIRITNSLIDILEEFERNLSINLDSNN
jgi:hypothetical protein